MVGDREAEMDEECQCYGSVRLPLEFHEKAYSFGLRQWAFEQATRIYPGATETEAIESADAILAWVTKRNTND